MLDTINISYLFALAGILAIVWGAWINVQIERRIIQRVRATLRTNVISNSAE